MRDAYWRWAEERFLAPIKEQFPNLYAWIVEWQKAWVARMTEIESTEGDAA